jgi:hypothetical protein
MEQAREDLVPPGMKRSLALSGRAGAGATPLRRATGVRMALNESALSKKKFSNNRLVL